MSIVNQINELHTGRRRSMVNRYRQILFSDDGSGKHVRELDDLMRELGITPEKLAADVQALAEFRRLSVRAAAHPRLQAKAERLREKHKKLMADNKAKIQELENETLRSWNDLQFAEGDARGAYKATARIDELRPAHPELLEGATLANVQAVDEPSTADQSGNDERSTSPAAQDAAEVATA